jgi:hypothetical protein
MANEETAELLAGEIFPEDAANVYAVLDGASVPALVRKLYELRPEYECLYRGELAPDMAEVAPYLVRLDPESAFTHWVLEEGWGGHWGLFAATDADMRAARRHFRSLLVVYTHDGRPQQFRYYDPRVMRIFLPTCNAGELRVLFGPVTTYLLEGEDPRTLLRFRLAEGSLRRESRRVAPAED